MATPLPLPLYWFLIYFNMPESIQFLKLRASYAEVGNGAPAYSFGNSYTPQAPFWKPTGLSPQIAVPYLILDLKNESTTAKEIGLDLRMFDGLINLDMAVYKMNSYDQIIQLPVAKTSGYDYTLTNGGEISNAGIEIALRD